MLLYQTWEVFFFLCSVAPQLVSAAVKFQAYAATLCNDLHLPRYLRGKAKPHPWKSHPDCFSQEKTPENRHGYPKCYYFLMHQTWQFLLSMLNFSVSKGGNSRPIDSDGLLKTWAVFICRFLLIFMDFVGQKKNLLHSKTKTLN